MKKKEPQIELVTLEDAFIEDIYNSVQGLHSRFLFFRDQQPEVVATLLHEGWVEEMKSSNKRQMYVITQKLIEKFHGDKEILSNI